MYINAYLFTISGEISIAGKKKRGGRGGSALPGRTSADRCAPGGCLRRVPVRVPSGVPAGILSGVPAGVPSGVP